MNSIVCVYRIKINDYQYFGSTYCFKNRIRQHKWSLVNGKHGNPFLQRVFDKYKTFEAEILQIADQDEILKLEQQYINQNYGSEKCLNIAPIAGSRRGVPHSEESRLKLSLANTGKKRTPEQIEAMKKRGLSPQFIEASLRFSRNRPPETIEKIRQNALGHTVSQETREKIRQSLAKITWDDAREIRRLDSLGVESRPTIAKKFGISNAMVHKICKNTSWVEVS